jgi:hypothetical protein
MWDSRQPRRRRPYPRRRAVENPPVISMKKTVPTSPQAHLDTPRIIKEEPNSAQRRVPPHETGPGACRTFWPQRGKRTNGSDIKRARTSLGLIRYSIYPIRTNCVSRFESKSFRRNILEPNAGGEGVPPPGSVLPTQNPTIPHASGPIRHTIYPIRTNRVSRFESKSLCSNILESNARGGGGHYSRIRATTS